jgi:electron transfer flavoprotein alpha subunit
MTTLLLAEVHNGHLNDSTAKALTAASALGAPVHILVASASGRASGRSDRGAGAVL